MRKLQLVFPLILIFILVACGGNVASPVPGQSDSALRTAAVGTVLANAKLTSTPEASVTEPPMASATPLPAEPAVATGPQYGSLPAATPTLNFSPAQANPVPWQTPVKCLAEAAP